MQAVTVWLLLNEASYSYFIYNKQNKKKERGFEQKLLINDFFLININRKSLLVPEQNKCACILLYNIIIPLHKHL